MSNKSFHPNNTRRKIVQIVLRSMILAFKGSLAAVCGSSSSEPIATSPRSLLEPCPEQAVEPEDELEEDELEREDPDEEEAPLVVSPVAVCSRSSGAFLFCGDACSLFAGMAGFEGSECVCARIAA